MTPIYLDYNATTPLLPEVVEAMLPYLQKHFGNPSSAHVFGRRARQAVDTARAQVARLIDCSPDEIVFTSGGTEANNLAIRGSVDAEPRRKHVITSVIEHPATAAPCRFLEQRGWQVSRAGVDSSGRVSPGEIAALITDDTFLLTVMHANNETGTIQPIDEIARAAHARGVLVHSDAAQSVGKIPVGVRSLDVDLLSIAGHKLYGPKGVGALYVRSGTSVEPLVRGAGHERGLRPGTENVASIVGLGKACEIAAGSIAQESRRVRALRDNLWELLRSQISGLGLNGHEEDRLPNTLNLRFPGVRGSALLGRVPGIAASTGSACHEGGESASSVLLAMGLGAKEALGSVRLSLGRATTAEDVTQAAELLVQAWNHLF